MTRITRITRISRITRKRNRRVLIMTYISHYGIKGQKWGVRRYQNTDGTLTEAGKKKYAKSAYQGKMNDAQRSQYAKYRVQQVGKNKAVNQEVIKFLMSYIGRGLITGATASAVETGASFAVLYGAAPLAIAGTGVAAGITLYNAGKTITTGVRGVKNAMAISAVKDKRNR